MTGPMNNTLGNSSRERAQNLYIKNAKLEIKRRKAAQSNNSSDSNAWQQMRENCVSILLEDLDFAEEYHIDYSLWLLHYSRVKEFRSELNAQVSAADAAKIRVQLKTFLTDAKMFYLRLMKEILIHYGKKFINEKKSISPLISSHIYLGDLVRYTGLFGEGDSKSQAFAQAEYYYLEAAFLWPSSGNAHHQLAVLALYTGDELLTVYRYFRSLAADSPFVIARENLLIAFEKNRQNYFRLLKKTEPVDDKETTVSRPLKAFGIKFVRLIDILFTLTSSETFTEVCAHSRSDFIQLLHSGYDEGLMFGSDLNEVKLYMTRFTALMILTVNHAIKETEIQSNAKIFQPSVVLQIIFDFMALVINRCSQFDDPSRSYLLPGILVFIEWLAGCEDDAVTSELENQATKGSPLWKYLESLLDKIIESEDETTNHVAALPEDIELRGFLPLNPDHLVFDASGKGKFGGDGTKQSVARVQRIIAAARALVTSYFRAEQGNEVSDTNMGSEVEGEIIVYQPRGGR